VTTSLGVEPEVQPGGQGVYTSERLSLGQLGKVLRGKAAAANRTREIRPSGMRGGLTETWAMAEAKRARTAETPKLPSFYLRLRALYLYPTCRTIETALSMRPLDLGRVSLALSAT
jgi:hypothetical protein